jgi:hypothetical protein
MLLSAKCQFAKVQVAVARQNLVVRCFSHSHNTKQLFQLFHQPTQATMTNGEPHALSSFLFLLVGLLSVSCAVEVATIKSC